MLEAVMSVISMLRGVNVAGHQRIKMEALRELYVSLRLRDPQTNGQGGNVVFNTRVGDLDLIARRIERAIKRTVGFSTPVILRTLPELRDCVVRNPFAGRRKIDPKKLFVVFLADRPGPETHARLRSIKTDTEEMRLDGREVYIYCPSGMRRSKLSAAVTGKGLRALSTFRSWNSVTKLLEIAERLEATAPTSRRRLPTIFRRDPP